MPSLAEGNLSLSKNSFSMIGIHDKAEKYEWAEKKKVVRQLANWWNEKPTVS